MLQNNNSTIRATDEISFSTKFNGKINSEKEKRKKKGKNEYKKRKAKLKWIEIRSMWEKTSKKCNMCWMLSKIVYSKREKCIQFCK